VDVYEPGPGDQLNDFNPGIADSGLFWTVAIPRDSIRTNLARGTASMHVKDIAVLDFGDLVNALLGGGPPPVPATLSFDIRWHDPTERVRVRDRANDFAATLTRTSAQMEWSARVGDFEFVSDPLDTSSSSFAEIGHERNGRFFS